MKKILLLLACLVGGPAYATCTSPLSVKDGAGATQTIATTLDGSSNCQSNVSVPDGANITQGAKADAKSTATDTTPITIMSVLKQISASIQAAAASLAGSLSVTGTFWQATQPISATSLPLPTGAATSTKQPALGTAGTPSADVISVQGVAGGTAIPTSSATGATAANQATEIGSLATIATNSAASIPTTQSGTAAAVIGCDKSIVYDASTNGSTQLVALSSGQKIYICGYSILAAGTVNAELDYGTGTACATGNNKMTPSYQLIAQVGLVDGSPFYRGLSTIASNAMCIKTSAGVAVQAIVYYTQF